MPIQFQCPHCATTLRVPDGTAGRETTCPSCSQKLTIPSPDAAATQTPAAPAASPPAAAPAGDSSQNQKSAFVPPPFSPPSDDSPSQPAPATDQSQPGAPPSVQREAAASQPTVNPQTPSTGGQPPQFPVLDGSAASAPPAQQGFPPADPVFAAQSADGIVQDTPPSIAQNLRQRSRSRVGGWIGPLLCIVCVAALYGGYYWYNLPKLEGTLTATALTEFTPETRLVERSLADVPPDIVDEVLNELTVRPIRLQSNFMNAQMKGSPQGIEVSIEPGPNWQFYEIKYRQHEFLTEYYEQHKSLLDRDRKLEIRKGMTDFFEETHGNSYGSNPPPDFKVYRDLICMNKLVGGLGYNVMAIVNKVEYACVYEDVDSIYFLLPANTKHFTLVGRKKGSRPLFPGKFTVNVR